MVNQRLHRPLTLFTSEGWTPSRGLRIGAITMRIEWTDHGRLTTGSGERTLSATTGFIIASLISLLMWAVIVGVAIVL